MGRGVGSRRHRAAERPVRWTDAELLSQICLRRVPVDTLGAKVVRSETVLERVLGGKADTNIRVEELRTLLLGLGFSERTRGSHHMFGKSGIEEQINIQREGAKAKPYQVKQVRAVV